MLNKILLQGRLADDPELRHTQSNTAAASFSLAVERDFKDKATGQRGVDFLRCITWGSTAEHVARYMSKGRMVVLEGRLQVRSYTDKEGNRRYATEVQADRVYFAGSDPNGKTAGGSYGSPDPTPQFRELEEEESGVLPF